ncbi:hypothetical protein [Paenibacillus sp. YIM B09110]|uniref:hypothetical protein n=1 Tax=Paenibacillus sp. YIM B09110 TaxID=3126102 RepID=UPI00301B985C
MSLGAIITGISAVISTIASVGSMVATYGKSIFSALNGLDLLRIAQVVDIICTTVDLISKLLGLENKDTVDELGAKALQSDKQLEDFDSVQQYIDYLNKEIQIDQTKMKEMSLMDKIACQTVGTAILSKGIEEKKDILIPGDFWTTIGKQAISPEFAMSVIEGFKEAGFQQVQMTSYLKGDLKMEEMDKSESIMMNSLKKLNPELSDDQMKERLGDMIRSANTEG